MLKQRKIAAKINRGLRSAKKTTKDLNNVVRLKNWDERKKEILPYLRFPNYFQSAKDLSFNEIIAVSVARCNRWHPGGVDDWSLSDWSNATLGELGEAANIIKKLRRVEDRIANHNERGRNIKSLEEARKQLGTELADTFLYLVLLSVKARIHLPDEIIAKFNKKSVEYGFPERLPIKGSRGLYQKRA